MKYLSHFTLSILCAVFFVYSYSISVLAEDGCFDMDIVSRGIYGLVWSPDGSRVAAAVYEVDLEDCIRNARIEILDGASGAIISTLQENGSITINNLVWRDAVRLLSGDQLGWIRQWDTNSGQMISSIQASNTAITSLSIHPDGNRILAGGYDNVARVFDFDGNLLQSYDFGAGPYPGLTSSIHWNAYSPNGLLIAVSGISPGSSDTFVRIMDAESLTIIATLPLQFVDPVVGDWSPDSTRIAIISDNHSGQIWDVTTLQQISDLQGHLRPIIGISWSSDGIQIATGSQDGTVKIWNAINGQFMQTIQPNGIEEVYRVDWNVDGKLAFGGQVTIDPRSGATPPPAVEIRLVPHFFDPCDNPDETWIFEQASSELSWSPDGNRLAFASYSVNSDQCFVRSKVEILDQNGQLLMVLVQQNVPIWGLAWDASGTRLATSDAYGYVTIWNALSGQLLNSFRLSNRAILELSWHPNNLWLAAGGYDNNVIILDAATGQVIMDRSLGATDLPGLTAAIIWMKWNPDGTYLAVGNADGMFYILNGLNLSSVMTMAIGQILGSWSPDGSKIIMASDGTDGNIGYVWDVETGQNLFSLNGHLDRIYGMAWSPFGDFIVTSSRDATIRIWNAATGELLSTFTFPDSVTETLHLDWSVQNKIAFGVANNVEAESTSDLTPLFIPPSSIPTVHPPADTPKGKNRQNSL
ncbi:MAG: PD40 domain-containing protein [Anaerolineae bacterium]|nr:PD40 domain-containing protein [Anaerolineae bacterium]